MYVSVGDLPLLLKGEAVYEVLTLDEHQRLDAETTDHVTWRNQTLPVVSLKEVFEIDGGNAMVESTGIVYDTDDGECLMMVVDKVDRLQKLNESDLLPLRGVPEKTQNYFRYVYSDDSTKHQVYLLNHPLPKEMFVS